MGGMLGKLSRLSLNSPESKANTTDEKIVSINENVTPKRCFIADNLLDPRSATLGIKRTPMILTKVGNETPLKATPYLETDLDEEAVEAEESKVCDDEDVIVLSDSEDNISADVDESLTTECDCSITASPLNKIKLLEDDGPSDDDSIDTISDIEIINVNGKIMNSPAVAKMKKTLVYEDVTPTSESTPVKQKSGRTPLGLVSTNNSPLPSPLGGKQWRGFREERIRLGLENTPPASEPFRDSIQSAPGKVGARRAGKKVWTRTNWALDDSLVI